jgi:hypothetical protein
MKLEQILCCFEKLMRKPPCAKQFDIQMTVQIKEYREKQAASHCDGHRLGNNYHWG